MAFTRFGVRFGLACSINATVPVTTGAAMLVPGIDMYGVKSVVGQTPRQEAFTRNLPPCAYIEPSLEMVDTVPTPDATRSGFAMRPTAGPRELNAAILSSFRVTVPSVDDAPTVSTHGA